MHNHTQTVKTVVKGFQIVKYVIKILIFIFIFKYVFVKLTEMKACYSVQFLFCLRNIERDRHLILYSIEQFWAESSSCLG